MSFSTLAQVRQNGLNPELGLSVDSDDSFGSTTQRNFYLRRALEKLWPDMGRLMRFQLTTTGAMEYDLTALAVGLRAIERIQVLDASGNMVDALKSWQLYVDETGSGTSRLTLQRMASGITLDLIGYAPYKVCTIDADVLDLPPEREYVICAGARVEAYRAKANGFANFERLANENRPNALSAAEILELLRIARAEWEQYRAENARPMAAPHRAMQAIR